jgi:lyso-ornithine lipid O-acyltransferase
MPATEPSRTRAVLRTAAFVGYTSGTLAAFEVHERLVNARRRTPLLDAYRRRYCRDALSLFGVDLLPDGDPTPSTGPRLVVANHRSVVDIPLLLGLFGGHVLSRADVSRWPLLGRVARRAGTIFVDRGDHASGAGALRAIRSHLRRGETVIVFPEGTTHRGDQVRPFRAGAFAAAKNLDAEIVPVGLAYQPGTEYVGTSFGTHLLSIAERPRTRVAATVGEPLPGDRSSADLAVQSREAVQALVQRARTRLG